MNAVECSIGGQFFETRRFNMLRYEGTFFHALLGSERWSPDSEGAYFIDVSPELFEFIMEHMRGNTINVDDLSEASIAKLKALFEFFQIPLPAQLTARTSNRPGYNENDPRCHRLTIQSGELKLIDRAE